MGRRRRLRTRPLIEVGDDLPVERVVAEHLAELLAHRPVHGLAAGERLRCLRAPPREFRAPITPSVASELGQGRDDSAVFLLLVDASQRQLPTHVGLDLAVMAPFAHRVQVQRATGAGGEPRPGQEDAGVVDEARAPFDAPLLVFPALRVDALGPARLRVLPLAVGQFLRCAHDAVAVAPASPGVRPPPCASRRAEPTWLPPSGSPLATAGRSWPAAAARAWRAARPPSATRS